MKKWRTVAMQAKTEDFVFTLELSELSRELDLEIMQTWILTTTDRKTGTSTTTEHASQRAAKSAAQYRVNARVQGQTVGTHGGARNTGPRLPRGKGRKP